MKKKQWILGLAGLAALAALVVWGRDRIHFDFGVFWSQLAQADWRKIAIALGCIYVCYAIRSVRWALLLRHNKKVGPFTLLGTQVIGFTAIALLGRVAEPVRPYLVAKRTGLTFSSQLAVYLVERLLDAGAMVLIFSSVILMTAWFGQAGALPHVEVMKKVSYGALTTTVAGALFLVAVRMAGGVIASFFERAFSFVSQSLGRAIGEKIRAFRSGLNTLRTPADFAIAMAVSLSMWGLITMAYLEITTAFVANPQLAQMTPAKCMVLMASSIAVSGFQLPVLGWFTQIGAVAAALSGFFGVAAEPATACSATLLLVGFLGIAPIGLIWARFEHVSLRKIAAESEHAEEALAADEARD
ncbi:MAG: lysylphosphatidylglycerol synthase transmembrane domain-containing protein [Terracidiphilus sp.]